MRKRNTADEAKDRLRRQKHPQESTTFQRLVQQLDDADNIERAEIVDKLDKLGTDEALTKIGELLLDKSQVVRQTVARILMRQHPRYVEFLHKLVLYASVEMRFAALDLITDDPSDHHLGVLMACVEDDQPPEIQEKAISILQNHPNVKAKLVTYFWLDKRRAHNDRIEHKIQEDMDFETFKEIIDEAIEDIAEESVESEYFGIRTPVNYRQSFETLLQFISEGKWGDQQTAVNAVQELVEAITVDLGAEYVLIREYLVARLNDPVQMVRWVVVQALAALQDRETIEALIPHLKDPSWTVRVATIRALTAMDSRELGAEIAHCVNDPNGTVRLTAIEALGKLKSRRQTRIIANIFVKSEERSERLVALEALKQMNATKVFPVLLYTLNDQDLLIRWHVAKTLSELADPSCEEWADDLVFHLTDTYCPGDENIRINDFIYEALVRIDSPSTRKLLARWRSTNGFGDE